MFSTSPNSFEIRWQVKEEVGSTSQDFPPSGRHESGNDDNMKSGSSFMNSFCQKFNGIVRRSRRRCPNKARMILEWWRPIFRVQEDCVKVTRYRESYGLIFKDNSFLWHETIECRGCIELSMPPRRYSTRLVRLFFMWESRTPRSYQGSGVI